MGSITVFCLVLASVGAAVTRAGAEDAAASPSKISVMPQRIVRLPRNLQRRVHLAQDLRFTQEPPRQLHFTNTSGAVVDCVAKGVPEPTITWTFADGRPLSQVGGLLQVAENGSLVFPPFPAHRYDTRVHSAVYTCRASSPVGTLLATPTVVRAEQS